jgi:hypothetical protein
MAAAVILFTVSIAMPLVGPQQAAAAAVALHFKTTEVVVQTFSQKWLNECEYRLEGVWAAETGEGPIAFYLRYDFNGCTHEFGRSMDGYAPATTFIVSNALSSAHVVATIPTRDINTGESRPTVHVDNWWTATGGTVVAHYTETNHQPGDFLFKEIFRGVSRNAEMTGTVVFTGVSVIQKGYTSLTAVRVP